MVTWIVLIGGIILSFVPGIVAYMAAGMVKAALGPEKWAEWLAEASAPNATTGWQGRGSSLPARLGRYRIVGLLGRGGMGSVWRGRDDALGRDAAVKVVDGPFGSEAVRRFGEEARAAAALASPHIVQIWEYAPDARPPFLAMEYVAGRSVAQLVRAGGPQPTATVIDCAAQVLAGLAAAHARGIVHRDIKPANILLATSGPSAGTYKLTDFGLATSPDGAHSFTATGTLLGTLSYLAPEVALGDDATPSSDLYALGATLHEMLTGRPPISAESPLKLLRKITTEPVTPIASVCPGLPADLAAWLDRLVARDPAERFASAEEALRALRGVEGFSSAKTDLARARTAPSDDASPWHRRPAPDAPALQPQPTAAPPDLVPDIVGRAMAFETAGRDALGEDSILDIARELNIDSAAVREALLARRRGEGVTQVFRTALAGEEPPSDESAWAWIGLGGQPHGRDAGLPWLVCVAVLLAVAGAVLSLRVARTGTAERIREANARQVAPWAVEVAEATPRRPGESASGAEAPLGSPAPPAAKTAPLPPPVVPIGVGIFTLYLIAFGVGLAVRALRRRRGRNSP